MLPIGIYLHGTLVPVALGVEIAGAHGTTHAKIERQRQYRDALAPGRVRGAVRRSVINDDDVRVQLSIPTDFVKHFGECLLLVPRGNNDEERAHLDRLSCQ